MADKLVIKIDGDDSGFKKSLSGIGGVAKKGISAIGKGFAVASAAGVAAVTAITTSAVKSYGDFEQLSGGIETLFGTKGAKSVEEYAQMVGKSVDFVSAEYEMLEQAQQLAMENASKAYETAGMSANDYMEISTSLAAALNASSASQLDSAELANQAIIDMSDNANKMGTDVSLIQTAYQGFAKQNYTMLDNLKLGYGGTKTEMERLLADAQKISGVKYDISSFADVTEAIHVIQEEMGIAGTTSREAATTIQGSASMMKASWENLLTGMADPTQNFEQLLQNFISSVGTFAGNLLPVITTAAQGVLQMVEGLLPQIPALLQQILPVVMEGITGIVNGIIQVLPQLIQTLIDALPQIIPALVSAWAQINIAVAQIIGQLAASLPQLIQPLLKALPEIIQTVIDILPTLIPEAINGLVQAFVILVAALPQIIQPIIDNLPMIITSITGALIDNLPILIQGLIQLVVALAAALPQICMALLEAVGGIAVQIGQALFNALPGPVQNAFSAAFDAIKVVWDLVRPYFELVWNNIKAVFSVVGEVLGGFFEVAWTAIQAVWDVVCSYFTAIWDTIAGIFSVVGSVLSGNFSDAWEAIKGIVSSWGNYFKSIWEGIKSIFSAVGSWFSGIFSAAWEAIKSVWGNVTTFFTQVWDNIKGVFNNAVSSMSEIGRNIIEGLGNGISNAKEWLCGKVRELCSNAKEAIKNFFGIHSPAKKMIPIGKYIVEGMAIGIRLASSTIKDAMSEINETILRSDMERNLSKAKTREEMEKIIDESNLNILENEREFLIQSQLLKDSELEADKERLEILEENADTEKQIYDSLNGYIEDRKNDYIDKLEDIKDAQEDFADSLKTSLYRTVKTDWTIVDGEIVDTDYEVDNYKLTDWDETNKRARQYQETLSKNTDRLKAMFGDNTEAFNEILKEIRKDDHLLLAIDKATDDNLLKWVKGYQENKKIREETADESFADNEFADLRKSFENEFGTLPDTFFTLGEDSAANFKEKFIAGIKNCVAEAQRIITETMNTMFPTAALASAGGGNINSNSYSATYIIQANEGESLNSTINKAKDHETYNKMSGGW